MIASTTKTRKGKYCLERKKKHSMPMQMLAFVLKWFGIVFAGFLIGLCVYDISSYGETPIVNSILLAFLGSMVLGALPAISNKGTLVESICIDYDNQKMVLQCNTLMNRKYEVAIPLERLVYKTRESLSYRLPIYDRIVFYDGHQKKAVLVNDCFGWEGSNAIKKLQYQLNTYLPRK